MRRPRLTDKVISGISALARAMEFELENRWLEQFPEDFAKEQEASMRVGIEYITKLRRWKLYQKENQGGIR